MKCCWNHRQPWTQCQCQQRREHRELHQILWSKDRYTGNLARICWSCCFVWYCR
jgi:hypothetical protein